ncbi:MAG: hypothetical protein QXW32_07115 [Nitrososphaerales archaeon]
MAWLDCIDIVENLDQVLRHAQYCKMVRRVVREVKGGYWVRVEAGSIGWEGVLDEDGLKRVEAKLEKLQQDNLDIEVIRVVKRVPRAAPLTY